MDYWLELKFKIILTEIRINNKVLFQTNDIFITFGILQLK